MPIPPYVTPFDRHHDQNPFDRGSPMRALRVFVDQRLMVGDADGDGAFKGYATLPGGLPGYPEASAILRNYFKHEWVDGLFVTDDPEVVGGVVLDPPDIERNQLSFTIRRENSGVWTGIDYYSYRLEETKQLASRHMISHEEALGGVLFHHVATCAGSDVVVTHRKWLLAERGRVPDRCQYPARVVSPAEGLALVALFLRWRKQTFRIGEATLQWDATSMRWAAARAALPSWWRWRQACCIHSRMSGDRTLEALTESCLTRVSRTLAYRDLIHGLSSHDLRSDKDEMLGALDSLLYSLVGAFDATARVADICCELTTKKQDVGWQKANWRKKLAPPAPSLHEFVDQDAHMQNVFKIIRCLRNTIHNEALSSTGYSSSAGEQVLVRLPPDEERELLDLLGEDAPSWGLRPMPGSSIALDARLFIERIVPAAARALDGIMLKTPIAKLQGYTPKLEHPHRPDENWKFSPTTAHRLRLLYGLPAA